MVAKTREEWDEMTLEEKREHIAAEEINVFGAGFKRNAKGVPQEQGLGSPAQPTIQSMAALLQQEGQSAYDAAIADATKRGVWPPKGASR
jgi:hypothetical protein